MEQHVYFMVLWLKCGMQVFTTAYYKVLIRITVQPRLSGHIGTGIYPDSNSNSNLNFGHKRKLCLGFTGTSSLKPDIKNKN